MIGKIISNYKITDFIEEGGMGTVYKGVHIYIDRTVAIKVLNSNLTNNPEFKSRFLNEANILAKLNHPNIVIIYDFTQDESNFYIITEFLEGTTLSKLIQDDKLPSVKKYIDIFRQILSGIDYAHKNGVIHRDLKPSNVIVSSIDTVKILDFGIAKLSDAGKSMTKTGTKMGSLYYMSPEQVLGKELDLRTDIYSLGVVFFEMLTKKIPYDSDTGSDYELMNSILNQQTPALDLYIPDIDPSINMIIQKACAKNPEDRFQSCAEFSNAFNSSEINYTLDYSDRNTSKIIKNNYQNDFKKTKILDQDQTKYQPIKKSSHKTLILSLIGIFIVVTIAAIIIVNLNNSNYTNNTSQSGNEIVKEEKNIKGEENSDKKEIENENVSKNNLKNILNKWITSIKKKEDLHQFYSEFVNYYKGGIISVDKVMQDKKKFYKTYDRIELNPENISVENLGNNKYKLIYDKSFECNNYQKAMSYNGKVKSNLVFVKANDEYLITEELDEKVYYTSKDFLGD